MTGQALLLTKENMATEPLVGVPHRQRVSVSISGDFNAKVTLQRKLDGVHWRDWESWSGATEATYVVDELSDLRLIIKAGDFVDGEVLARLGAG